MNVSKLVLWGYYVVVLFLQMESFLRFFTFFLTYCVDVKITEDWILQF